MYQLGIVSLVNKKGSLLHTIDKTSTQQGHRLLKKSLLAPLTCKDKLNERYDMIEQIRKCEITSKLRSLVDIEKYVHKWRLGKISPHEFVIMVYCFPTIHEIVSEIHDNTSMKFDKYNEFVEFDKQTKSRFFYELLERYYSLSNIESNVFQKGVKPELDLLQDKLDMLLKQIDDIITVLNKKDKSDKKQAVIKFEKTAANDQWYFSTTSKRVDSLKKANALNDYSVRSQKSNVRLFHTKIDSIRMEYIDTLNQMIEQVKNEFVNELSSLEDEFGSIMKDLVTFIGLADFYNCGSILIDNFGYSRPTITQKDESFVKCRNLRHAVIERLDQNTAYVPNDVSLPDNKHTGMLLFGLNGGGKSSYMKSVGLCVVLAQIGYWVPCEHMEYSPFTRLFTRISGDDNVIKGLSSFAVEMKELRGILQKSDNKSLVLGDEICKGTEQESALGIVAASLITLSTRNKSRFIFATHLHTLSKMDEIISKVNIYHLSVECKDDNIIYHRKLLPGSGPSLYGLEVARHMLHDFEVIKLAEQLRPRPQEDSIKESKYNPKVIVKECEICQVNANLDVHHIQFQCTSNEHNLVQHGLHKNSQSNLVVLCKKHHDDVHQNKIRIHGWKETSNGIILDWDRCDNITKKKCKYTDTEIEIIKSFSNNTLSQKMKIMKLKNEHNIEISLSTFRKYM